LRRHEKEPLTDLTPPTRFAGPIISHRLRLSSVDVNLIRFPPITMTTMAALLGAVPIAFGFGGGRGSPSTSRPGRRGRLVVVAARHALSHIGGVHALDWGENDSKHSSVTARRFGPSRGRDKTIGANRSRQLDLPLQILEALGSRVTRLSQPELIAGGHGLQPQSQ
jgi:hypothetical protein